MSQAKILIVEDENDVAELIRYKLEKAGYETDTAMTGPLALEKVLDNRPDLILLDIMIPEMDGLQVCDNLKNNPVTADIPVVMLTAKSSQEDIDAGFAMDADDYITKPFSPRDLLTRIRTVLHQKAIKAK